jgi:hypothetical protein
MDETKGPAGNERLALRLDAGSSFFLFGYYIRALEDIAADGWRSGEGAPEAMRVLARLRETASRSEKLVQFGAEIGDVARLLEERTRGTGRLEEGLAVLLERCAKRWFQRVRELPKRQNSLAVDIAFNLELAGLEGIAADLYEAIVCLEAGAYRASRLMSCRALEVALNEAGAPGGELGSRLGWARGNGLIGAADVRSALASFEGTEVPDAGERTGAGKGPDGPEDGRGPEEEDCSSAEWALETALRLSRKLLRQRIEEGLLGASRAISASAGPAR